MIWYGGGKLAADLTLPKLRARWAGRPEERLGQGIPGQVARAVLRGRVTEAAAHARDDAGFFAHLRQTGVLVRVRFSEINPGQVTGYAVALAGHVAGDGAPRWYGGGRLAAELTLPQLRRGWDQIGHGTGERSGTFRFTAPERDMLFRHAARQAAAAAEHIRRSAGTNPDMAADAAWAAAATFDVAARALRDPALQHAADAYDRASRAPYGRSPRRTRDGDRLRATARLLALAGDVSAGSTVLAGALIANLVALTLAVTELRQSQEHAAQAAAARKAAEHMHAAMTRASSSAFRPGPAERLKRARAAAAGDPIRRDFPVPLPLGQSLASAAVGDLGGRPHVGRQPPKRAGPGR